MSLFARVNPYWLYIKWGAVLLLLAGMWGWGYHTKAVACQAAQLAHEAQDTADRLAASEAARKAEQAHADALAAIAEQHEQDNRDAEADHARVVDDLRAGKTRLQLRWRGCEATTAASAGQLDAAARDREESAARIVRAAREADDWIKRLQDVIRSDRE